MEPGVESDDIKHHLEWNVTFHQFLLLRFCQVSPAITAHRSYCSLL